MVQTISNLLCLIKGTPLYIDRDLHRCLVGDEGSAWLQRITASINQRFIFAAIHVAAWCLILAAGSVRSLISSMDKGAEHRGTDSTEAPTLIPAQRLGHWAVPPDARSMVAGFSTSPIHILDYLEEKIQDSGHKSQIAPYFSERLWTLEHYNMQIADPRTEFRDEDQVPPRLAPEQTLPGCFHERAGEHRLDYVLESFKEGTFIAHPPMYH